MANFEIVSFVGALPLKFGMTPEDVAAVLGAPDTSGPNWMKVLCYNYYSPGLEICVGFGGEGETADHFGIGRLSTVRYQGLDFFGDPTAWRALVRQNSDCQTWVGFILLCDLGIQLSGFHDNDPSQLAVVAFPRGAKEKHRSKFKPFFLPEGP